MTRTIISISDEDKKWLENYSRTHRQSAAETIRCAIKQYQLSVKKNEGKRILRNTAGIWKDKNVDGLDYVETLRNEWDSDES